MGLRGTLMASNLQEFIQGEKDSLNEIIDGLQGGGEELRTRAALALDTAAQILADQLIGKDTTIAEKALEASRLNIQASLSVGGYAVFNNFLREFLLRAAGFVAQKLILA